jgi:ComF family protein
MKWLHQIANDLKSLFYPVVCGGCGLKLIHEEDVLCLSCETALPLTHYHRIPDNPLEQKLWGRCILKQAAALYFFERHSVLQQLMHGLKYENKEYISQFLGEKYGEILKTTSFKENDIILPVPLHPVKHRARGYNQCSAFAKAIADKLDLEYSEKILYRNIANPSQTTKSRIDRWTNVEGIFKLYKDAHIEDRNIILVDDIATTGSTIESCVHALEKGFPKSISLLCMATGI